MFPLSSSKSLNFMGPRGVKSLDFGRSTLCPQILTSRLNVPSLFLTLYLVKSSSLNEIAASILLKKGSMTRSFLYSVRATFDRESML